MRPSASRKPTSRAVGTRASAPTPGAEPRRSHCATFAAFRGEGRERVSRRGGGVSRMRSSWLVAFALGVLAVAVPHALAQEALVPYEVVGDGIPKPLTEQPGDAVHGKTVILDVMNATC